LLDEPHSLLAFGLPATGNGDMRSAAPNAITVARPMPDVPPVTNTTLPAKS
jgi:hypothetical protein